MAAYLLRRIVELPLVLLVIAAADFALIHFVPGDPAAVLLGLMSTPETHAALVRFYGLDEPIPQQFVGWLGHVVRGDLGTSILTTRPVAEMIAARLPATVVLAFAASMLSIAIAFPAGLIAATHRNRRPDHIVMIGSLAGFSIPNFALAVFMILVFGVALRWFPIVVEGSPATNPVRAVLSYVMPTVALALYYSAVLSRQWRSSLVEVLSRDYIRTARGKGLAELRVLLTHASKNALIPVITIVALNLAYLLGGTIVIEQIFVIPGIGSLLADAALHRDYPVLQGIILVVALFYVLSSLLADIVYAWADPRIRYA